MCLIGCYNTIICHLCLLIAYTSWISGSILNSIVKIVPLVVHQFDLLCSCLRHLIQREKERGKEGEKGVITGLAAHYVFDRSETHLVRLKWTFQYLVSSTNWTLDSETQNRSKTIHKVTLGQLCVLKVKDSRITAGFIANNVS